MLVLRKLNWWLLNIFATWPQLPGLKRDALFKPKDYFLTELIAQESLSAKISSLQHITSHYQNSVNGTGCYKLWCVLCGMPVNLGAHVKLSEANNPGNMETRFPRRLKIIQSPTHMLRDILNQNTFPLMTLIREVPYSSVCSQSHRFAWNACKGCHHLSFQFKE